MVTGFALEMVGKPVMLLKHCLYGCSSLPLRNPSAQRSIITELKLTPRARASARKSAWSDSGRSIVVLIVINPIFDAVMIASGLRTNLARAKSNLEQPKRPLYSSFAPEFYD